MMTAPLVGIYGVVDVVYGTKHSSLTFETQSNPKLIALEVLSFNPPKYVDVNENTVTEI